MKRQNFTLRGFSPEKAEFPPNFVVRNVSDEIAKSIPSNFALGTFPTKRPNFRRISHSGTFPTKRPNFLRILHSWTFPPKRPNFRRISHSGRLRRNGRMNPDEFTPNFVLGDVSDETAE
ncbi:MAG: hypothetical protein Q8881_03880, partial [Sweet potato little leaf phytoplasma]|nr:hypothetical protein [Sweet potato little leaf phytoplasma]